MALAFVFVAAVLLGVLLPVFVARPGRTILPLYAGILPVASVVSLPIPLPAPFNTLSTALGGIAVASITAHLVLFRRARIPTPPLALWSIFLAWTLVTAFWALDLSEALQSTAQAVSLVLLLTLSAFLPTDEEDLNALRVALMVSAAAVGLYALFLVVSGANLPAHGVSQRLALRSEETNPNILAASLLLPLVVSIERLVIGGSGRLSPLKWRTMGGSATVLSLIAIIFTGSRGGLIAAAVAIVLTLAYCARLPGGTRLVLRTIFGTSLALMVVLGIFLVASQILPRTTDRILASEAVQRLDVTKGRGSGRLDIWTSGLLACRSHCARGTGVGNFATAYEDVFAISGAERINVGTRQAGKQAHNLYLAIAVETGLVGLTLFGLAVWGEWRASTKDGLKMLAPSLPAMIAALLVVNFFLSAIWFKYFWLVFVFIRVAEGAGIDMPAHVQTPSLPAGPAGLAFRPRLSRHT
jgi:O-antigen ligase